MQKPNNIYWSEDEAITFPHLPPIIRGGDLDDYQENPNEMSVKDGRQMNDLVINNEIRSENYRPWLTGFRLDSRSGSAEFNHIFVASRNPWPGIDIRKTAGDGNGLYIESDAGTSLYIKQNTDTDAIYAVSENQTTGGCIEGYVKAGGAPVFLGQQDTDAPAAYFETQDPVSTNFYRPVRIVGGDYVYVNHIWISDGADPNGNLDGNAGDICLNAAGTLHVCEGGTVWNEAGSGSMQLVPGAVEDNVATFDGAGQVKDSGLAVTSIITDDGGAYFENHILVQSPILNAVHDSGLEIADIFEGDGGSYTDGNVIIASPLAPTAGTAVLKDSGVGILDLVQHYIQYTLIDYDVDCTTGNGKAYIHIPPKLNGYLLNYCHAYTPTAGTTGTMTIQVYNLTDAVNMLSTVLSIDSGENGSDTAATPYVINPATDDVATNDVIRIDVTNVHTSPARGLVVTLGFYTPA